MRVVTCLCGARIEADGADALSDAYWKHTDGVHGDFPISDRRRDDAEAALRRSGGWDGVTAPLGDVEIRPLTPAAREDYLAFFDNDAFPDNPAWASCYCISYTMPMPPLEFEERTAAQNRADRAAQIDRGEASGVLAYSGGKVVGWCHAAPRPSLPQLDHTPGFASEDPEHTGAIVCFVIAPRHRGQGLARRLLDGGCDLLRERGLACIEAFPPKRAAGDAGAYHGRLGMYLDAGFEQVRDAGRHVVVRKAL